MSFSRGAIVGSACAYMWTQKYRSRRSAKFFLAARFTLLQIEDMTRECGNTEHEALMEDLQALVRVVQRRRPREIATLGQILRRASARPPPDKQVFVASCNLVMKSYGYRIRLEDGTLCMLHCHCGRNGKGCIQFHTASGSRGGFCKGAFELVRIDLRDGLSRGKFSSHLTL